MRRAGSVFLNFVRRVRRKVGNLTGSSGASTSKAQKPAEWIEDATNLSENFSSLVDPYATLPYSSQEIERAKKLEKLKEKEWLESPKPGTYDRRRVQNFNFDHIPIGDQVVVLFPGQGAQFVGMGAKLSDCSGAMKLFDKASEILGYDIKQICLEGPKTKLDQTIYCQPAIFVSSMAAWEKAKMEDDSLSGRVTHSAGFSIGEYNSLVLAKVLSFEDALRIVKVRAEAMHRCSQRISSGMLTVRVSAKSQLNQAMADARRYAYEENEEPVCEVANYLFCGVKVIGASETCMKYLYENQDRYIFKILKRLPVSGAFHTRLMYMATDDLKEAFSEVKFNRPILNIYSNFTGHLHEIKPAVIRNALLKQVSSPVKWEQIQQLLFRLHQDYKFPTYMEVGPGRQLGTMFLKISKKAMESFKNYSC